LVKEDSQYNFGYDMGSSNSDGNNSHNILTCMQDKAFDFCREDEGFEAIVEELQKYAKSKQWI
jgi:hypothetical protein